MSRLRAIAVFTAIMPALSSAQEQFQKIDQLRRIDVVAVDRQGRPVTSLQKTDFRVQEDNKTRDIVFFRFTGTQTMPGVQGHFSNGAGALRGATVILIDLLSDSTLGGAVFSYQITQAFKNLSSTDDLYLYFLTSRGELYSIHSLPQLDGELAPASQRWTENLSPMLDAALKKFNGFKPVDDRTAAARWDLTARALRTLGGQMQLVSGRRNLVWVTRGIPLVGGLDFSYREHLLCDALQRAQIAVYPVGAALGTERDLALDDMAALTGGRRYAYGEVSDAVRDSQADARANYQIAFLTPEEKPDGAHHKLRVRCLNKDVKLETLTGFSGLAAPLTPEEAGRKVLEVALHNPLDASDIGLRASVSPDSGMPRRMRFEIRVNPVDLLPGETPQPSVKILFLVAAYGPSADRGAINSLDINPMSEDATITRTGIVRVDQPCEPVTLDIHLSPQQYEVAAREGIVLHGSASVDSRVQKVRVIVVDSRLAAAGSVTLAMRQ